MNRFKQVTMIPVLILLLTWTFCQIGWAGEGAPEKINCDAVIEWNVSPDIFSIGPFTLRWYSLMFIFSFLSGYFITQKILRQEKKPDSYLDQLFIYVFVGTILGARLGHCLFYDPVYYLSNPLESLLFSVLFGDSDVG